MNNKNKTQIKTKKHNNYHIKKKFKFHKSQNTPLIISNKIFIQNITKNKKPKSGIKRYKKKKKLQKFLYNYFYSKIVQSKFKLLLLLIISFILIMDNLYSKPNKIIALILAGRKNYLEILMNYLFYLKRNNTISEIHFWQFTSNKDDEKYLESMSNVHKTTGTNPYYRNIYPLIYDKNFFVFKINIDKDSACIMINEKYEIIFNVVNDSDINVSLNISNNIYYGNQKNVFNKKKYFKYYIKIISNHIIIQGKKNLFIKGDVDDSTINSIKIKSLGNAEAIWDYKEIVNKDIKLYDTMYRKRPHWYEMYKYYLDYDFSIIIKVDDDISFIDINRFPEFINFIKKSKHNVTFPNLVNHAVSLYYNLREGIIPNSLVKRGYQFRSTSLRIYDYFKDGKTASIIHQYFLDHTDNFTNNNITPIQLDGLKPSICMFGIKKESFNYVYDPRVIWPINGTPEKYEFDDERYTYKLSNNYLYMRFVAVHYAFELQRKKGLGEHFLANYKNLSKKYALNL